MEIGTKVPEGRLELTLEAPINPDVLVCDLHLHLWGGPRDRGKYLLTEYLTDAGSGHNIINTIFIECSTNYRKNGPEELRPVGKTEFAVGQAERCANIKSGQTSVADGIVGFADLFLGTKVAPVIEGHAEASKGRLRGIRQICICDSDPDVVTFGNYKGMMMESKFSEGFE